jgi:sterol desaturase/sphingolipid hydroxylase (fatty acid hydroxylase superfamily)
MVEGLAGVIHVISVAVLAALPISIVLGIVFAALSYFWACNPGQPWWRKSDLITDICYWLIIPLVGRYTEIGFLVVGTALLFGITSESDLAQFFDDGHGPLAALPLWLQAVLSLIGTDVIMYWSHRLFHGQALWRFHAVHHSTKELEWISATRFHPVNIMLGSVLADVLMLFAGISPKAIAMLGTFAVAHSAFVHANLNWSLGPLRYVIAGPVFHRWHHTSVDQGGEKNFAPTFPILDIIFGTFYLPKGALPVSYGVADKDFPPDFGAQIMHPFK